MRRQILILLLGLLFPIASFAELQRGEVGVRFAPQGNYYFATVMRHGWDRPRLVRLGSVSEIDSLSRSSSLYRDKQMYQLLLYPLRDVLHTGETLFFVPGGQIRFINLAALVGPHGKRCFRMYKLFRVSSLEHLPHEGRKKMLEMQVEVFGGMDYYADPEEMWRNSWFCHSDRVQQYYEDIPGRIPYGENYTRLSSSRDETKSIFSLSRWVFIPKTGVKAQEEIFRQGTRRSYPYMMHLSTHSFQSHQPGMEIDGLTENLQKEITGMCCGLLFSGAGHTLEGREMPYRLNDGLLYSQEIIKLDMRWCDLLVLACCNTAEGPASRQTIFSLGNAFKEAGVHTLLLTLGGINDKATSVFMKYFYSYLVDGYTKHDALDRARADMMRNADFSDPVYWAPFIMLD